MQKILLLVKVIYCLLYARFAVINAGMENKLATRYCVVIIIRLQPKILLLKFGSMCVCDAGELALNNG